jgi:hypothetical protein
MGERWGVGGEASLVHRLWDVEDMVLVLEKYEATTQKNSN